MRKRKSEKKKQVKVMTAKKKEEKKEIQIKNLKKKKKCVNSQMLRTESSAYVREVVGDS